MYRNTPLISISAMTTTLMSAAWHTIYAMLYDFCLFPHLSHLNKLHKIPPSVLNLKHNMLQPQYIMCNLPLLIPRNCLPLLKLLMMLLMIKTSLLRLWVNLLVCSTLDITAFANATTIFANAVVTAIMVLTNWLFPSCCRFAFRTLLRPMIVTARTGRT